MVEIARFADPRVAKQAAYFLERHGIAAIAHTFDQSRSIGRYMTGAVGDAPVVVSAAQFEEARALLLRVMNGEFADEDSSRNTRLGLGAALAEALLPEPEFKMPGKWVQLAPVLAFAALIIVALGWKALERLMTG